MNDYGIPFSCFGFRVSVLCMLAHCHGGHVAIVNVVTYICAFPAVTSQNVCCDEGLFCLSISFNQYQQPKPNSVAVRVMI